MSNLTYEVVGFQNSEPNYEAMRGGQSFSGAWTLRNNSSVAWSGDYQLVFRPEATPNTADARSDLMGQEAAYALRELVGKEQVAPGETIQIRLNFMAPPSTGI